MSTNSPAYYVREVDGDREVPCETRAEAEQKAKNAENDLGMDVEIVEAEADEPADADEDDAAEVVDAEPVEPEDVPDTFVDLPDLAPSDADTPLPTGQVEEVAENIINELGWQDFTRLVWDPDQPQGAVPYDSTGLPYDRPEPSAEAYDLFVSVIEAATGIQYSVEDVDCELTDETMECTVTVRRESDHGEKMLVGMKTRDRSNAGLDHWRERLYTKARRNALKQDVPPTWVATLLNRYQEVR